LSPAPFCLRPDKAASAVPLSRPWNNKAAATSDKVLAMVAANRSDLAGNLPVVVWLKIKKFDFA
jgi:hypothetical protein